MSNFFTDIANESRPLLPFVKESRTLNQIDYNNNQTEEIDTTTTSEYSTSFDQTEDDTSHRETENTSIDARDLKTAKESNIKLEDQALHQPQKKVVPRLFSRKPLGTPIITRNADLNSRIATSKEKPRLSFSASRNSQLSPSLDKAASNDTLSETYGELIRKLENVNANLLGELKNSKYQTSKKEEEIEKLNTQLKQKEELYCRREDELADAKQKNSSLKSSFAATLEKLGTLGSEFAKLNEEKIQQDARLKDINRELQLIQEKNEKISRTVGDANTKLAIFKALSVQSKHEIEKQQIVIKNLERNLDETSGNLSEEKIQVAKLQQKMNEKEGNELKFLALQKDLMSGIFSQISTLFKESQGETLNKINSLQNDNAQVVSSCIEGYLDQSEKSVTAVIQKGISSIEDLLIANKKGNTKEMTELMEKMELGIKGNTENTFNYLEELNL
ncbi:uncharacterized protein J8A68_004779 [[Candida] subhashii]|uniref:SWI5-dependent HO expression protein 3 n=1 Tax=[Candida] subhashii TaxID=561895 RepID=A0A8J5QIF7_9ASCO|nr:uncharacterized protein J8A68_004779 [[Candida] subhashii]KAG7661721.1 hypothetical protein J8A68_004779 [[Candida] subhashii]